jgi:Asp-tRNA(Asn)/Glu-tRNA(Gln) amidotransferase A subunit family amidase
MGLDPEALWDAITPIGVFTAGLNVNGSPAASIPSGRSADGLPLGAQLIGRRGEDQRVLALARQLEGHLGGFDPLA